MRHIYVKTPDGLGKLNFYDKLIWWDYNYIVDHYKHKSKFYSGTYKEKYLVNAYRYRKNDIKFLHKKPLRHFIEKRQSK